HTCEFSFFTRDPRSRVPAEAVAEHVDSFGVDFGLASHELDRFDRVHGAVGVSNQAPINSVFAASIAPTPIYQADQIGLPDQLHTSAKTSFGPRIGFAWRPFKNEKTVVRGGYGRFIEAMLGTLTSAGWAVNSSDVASFTNTIANGVPSL